MKNMKYIFTTLIIIATILTVWLYCHTISIPRNNQTHDVVFPYYKYVKNFSLGPKQNICSGNKSIVILVTSYVSHVELRSAHRRTMSQDYLDLFNATRVFLLAQVPKNEKYINQKAIDDENNIYNDILQGNFVENYKNLTYKHLMGLHWAAKYCKNSTFILKVDDDTVFDFEGTYKMLQNFTNIDKNTILLGYMLNNTRPRREQQNKWFVTMEEYQYSFYPPYLSGWYYVTTPQVAALISNISQYYTNFWIDDILITGILREKLNVPLRHVPHDFWLEYYELLECCIRDMINKNIKCPYIIGPNGGRNNLIFEYHLALNRCKSNHCIDRPIDRSLKEDCVAFKDRAIFGNGQPKVEIINL